MRNAKLPTTKPATRPMSSVGDESLLPVELLASSAVAPTPSMLELITRPDTSIFESVLTLEPGREPCGRLCPNDVTVTTPVGVGKLEIDGNVNVNGGSVVGGGVGTTFVTQQLVSAGNAAQPDEFSLATGKTRH